MVQIGNEITNGIMGQTTNRDAGRSYKGVWLNADKRNKVIRYLRSASKAVRAEDKDTLITVQIETPEIPKYNDILSALKDGHVDYDVLGSSYYPFWSVDAKSNTPDTLNKVASLAEEKYEEIIRSNGNCTGKFIKERR